MIDDVNILGIDEQKTEIPKEIAMQPESNAQVMAGKDNNFPDVESGVDPSTETASMPEIAE